ncbi:predicted protein [Lodderomyces elongisporus NRRL YB-4239]|uniref:Uncharacterized protein n=1 Tax=Lodderomyces elongisporus (strain ATCC 11503 / CBS 2605 / JCM 1781 / NBRC 1676 / NRRL YB-4239) TaxID=379508 RepID=A5DWS1_LODEL|nr:predicted protein [Lodderomyces elongisporus NRRL YB-4239]
MPDHKQQQMKDSPKRHNRPKMKKKHDPVENNSNDSNSNIEHRPFSKDDVGFENDLTYLLTHEEVQTPEPEVYLPTDKFKEIKIEVEKNSSITEKGRETIGNNGKKKNGKHGRRNIGETNFTVSDVILDMIDLNFSSDNEEEVYVVDVASDKSTKKKNKDKQKEKKTKKAKNVVENVGDDSKVINVGRKDNLQLAKNTNTNTTLTSKNGNEKEEKEQEQEGKQEKELAVEKEKKKKRRKRGNKKSLDQSNIGSNQKTITHNEEETIFKELDKKSPEKLLEKAALINHSTPLSITKENEEEEKNEKEEEKLVDTQEEAANESQQEARHILIKNDENLQDETRKLKKKSKRNRNRTKANLLNAESKHPEKIDERKSLETCDNKSISCNKDFPKHKDGFVNKDVFTEDDMHPRRECENFSNEAKGASNKRREKLLDLVTKRTAPETNSCTSEDDNYAKLPKHDTVADPIAGSNKILSTQSKLKSKKARKLKVCEKNHSS